MLKKKLVTLTLLSNSLAFESELFEDPNDSLPPITIKKIASLHPSAPQVFIDKLMIIVGQIKENPLPNNQWILPKLSNHIESIESNAPTLKVYRQDDLVLQSCKTFQGDTFEYRAILCSDFLKYAHYQKGLRIEDEKNDYQGKLIAHKLVGNYSSHEIQIKIPKLLNVQELALELYELKAYSLTIHLNATINIESSPILGFISRGFTNYQRNKTTMHLGELHIKPTVQEYEKVKNALTNYFKWRPKNKMITQLLFEGNKIEKASGDSHVLCLQGNEDTNKRFSKLIKDLQAHISYNIGYKLKIYPYEDDKDFRAHIPLLRMEEEYSQEQASAERKKLATLIRNFAIEESSDDSKSHFSKSPSIYVRNIEITIKPDDILAAGEDLKSVNFLKNPKKNFKSPNNT